MDTATGESRMANVLRVSGELDGRLPVTELHLGDGRVVQISTQLLEQGGGAGIAQPGFEAQAGFETLAVSAERADGMQVIPLIEEQLTVGKQTVVMGTVRLQKTVQEYQEALHEPLAIRTFDVERVVLNQPVAAAPPVRQEGETTVYSLVEEQLVLTKQLILKEEVRVTRRDTERIDTQVVTLKRENLIVEREAGAPERS